MGSESGSTPPGGTPGASRDPRQVTEAVGAARKCPNCGSFSYREFFDEHGRAMCRCHDCGETFPAGDGV